MALPNSGTITMSMIKTEFPERGDSLSAYYGVAAGVPTSGKISFSDFYGKANVFNLNVTTSVASPDIWAMARNAGWNGTQPLIVNFNCPLVNTLRFDGTKTFPQGITLNISAGCMVGGVYNSGTAIYTRVPLKINNLGSIYGGGGNGGYGAEAYGYYQQSRFTASGGNGGRGQGFLSVSDLGIFSRETGARGSTTTYSGGLLVGDRRPWCEGAEGGNGGWWGAPGEVGSYNVTAGGDYSSYGINYPGQSGRPAGAYVDGSGYITWINQGDVRGRLV